MTKGDKYHILLKLWRRKFQHPSFAKDRAKIVRNKDRIAGSMEITSGQFERFLNFCLLQSVSTLLPAGYQRNPPSHEVRELGPIAWKFTQHRLDIGGLAINNNTATYLSQEAVAVGEKEEDCKELMAEILCEKIGRHLLNHNADLKIRFVSGRLFWKQ